MDNDILVKIFQTIDIVELTSEIGQVCRSWRDTASDPRMWRTLDLSMMKSNYIRLPSYPYIYVDTASDKLLTKVLKNALILSCGNISALFFHVYLFVSEEQLTFTAERYHLKAYFVLFTSIVIFTIKGYLNLYLCFKPYYQISFHVYNRTITWIPTQLPMIQKERNGRKKVFYSGVEQLVLDNLVYASYTKSVNYI